MRRKIKPSGGNVVGTSDGVDGANAATDNGHSGDDSTLAADSGAAESVIDPGAVASPAPGDTGEPRTRRKYTKRATAGDGEKASLGLNAIEAILHSIHLGVSALASAPELQLDPMEATAVAKGIAAVGRHYPAFQMSEKAADWGNLIVLAVGIYGPRMFAIKARRADTPRTPRPAQATAPQQQSRNAPPPPDGLVMTEVTLPGTNTKVQVPVGGWPH